MTFKRVAPAVPMLVLACASVFAQTQSSSILGTVVDPAGASVPSAKVTVTNTGTSATNTATITNSNIP